MGNRPLFNGEVDIERPSKDGNALGGFVFVQLWLKGSQPLDKFGSESTLPEIDNHTTTQSEWIQPPPSHKIGAAFRAN